MGKHSSDDSSPTGGVPTAGSDITMDSGATANIVEQARNRSDGFSVGDDRAIGSPPNWAAQDQETLYRGATVNNDPSTAEALSQSWISHGTELNRAANDLYSAISELGGAWVGQGAGAAQGTLVGIANSTSQASEAAHSMGGRMAQQAAAAAEVKKMPSPDTFDPGKELSQMLAGGPAALTPDMKAKYDASNNVKAQQVAYFTAYTKAMSEVDNTTPSFGPASLGLPPHGGHTGAGGPSVSGITAPQGVDAGAFGVLGVAGAGGANAGGAGGAAQPLHADATPAGFRGDLGVGPGGVAEGGAMTGIGGHTAEGTAQHSSGVSGTGIAGGLGLSALGGGLGVAAGRTLGQGSRSGSKQTNETNAASDNRGVGQSATGNAPQQGVVSPGGTIGGGATPPPAPMGAGAHQKEDEEHSHASFLIEPDPDDAFGANQATPPPVIGDWADDDEAEDR
jgi:hypothetical protein